MNHLYLILVTISKKSATISKQSNEKWNR